MCRTIFNPFGGRHGGGRIRIADILEAVMSKQKYWDKVIRYCLRMKYSFGVVYAQTMTEEDVKQCVSAGLITADEIKKANQIKELING